VKIFLSIAKEIISDSAAAAAVLTWQRSKRFYTAHITSSAHSFEL